MTGYAGAHALALAAVFSIPLLRGVRAAPAALALLTGPWLLAAAGLAAIPGLA